MDFIINVRSTNMSGDQDRAIRDEGARFCERWKTVPGSRLFITVNYHAHPHDYHVKTTACLPGGRIFTGARGQNVTGLATTCLERLDQKITSSFDKMAGRESHEETRREHETAALPDMERLRAAVEASDAATFRQILFEYDEPLGKVLKARIGTTHGLRDSGDVPHLTGLALDTLYLLAFEEFDRRPDWMYFRDWLFSLVDEAIDEIVWRRTEVEEEVSFFRSAGGSDSD